MIRRAKKRRLPFVPGTIGKWWGNNPIKKRQDDIDVLLLDRKKESGIFCECKFRSVLFDKSEFENLIAAFDIFPQIKNRCYFIFSKSGFTQWVKERAAEMGNVELITVDDLFSETYI